MWGFRLIDFDLAGIMLVVSSSRGRGKDYSGRCMVVYEDGDDRLTET